MSSYRNALVLFTCALFALVLAGCPSKSDSGSGSSSSGGGKGSGGKLEGTYHSEAGGAVAFDFKGDKVTVTLAGEQKTCPFKVDGDKITIINPQEGDMVLTRNSDGSLNTAWGTFSKK